MSSGYRKWRDPSLHFRISASLGLPGIRGREIGGHHLPIRGHFYDFFCIEAECFDQQLADSELRFLTGRAAYYPAASRIFAGSELSRLVIKGRTATSLQLLTSEISAYLLWVALGAALL